MKQVWLRQSASVSQNLTAITIALFLKNEIFPWSEGIKMFNVRLFSRISLDPGHIQNTGTSNGGAFFGSPQYLLLIPF